jgi:hypothetical protein
VIPPPLLSSLIPTLRLAIRFKALHQNPPAIIFDPRIAGRFGPCLRFDRDHAAGVDERMVDVAVLSTDVVDD